MKENKITLVLVAVFLILLLGLGGAAFYYHGEYSEQQKANEQLKTDNDRQSSVIASQSLQFNRFNQIAAAVKQYDTQITASSQEKQIEYRTILKTEPTCALAVPSGVAGRLLEYANSLRASAMHADSSLTDSSGTGTVATGTLTYCQAVLWIDPLLTAIDQANSQLDSIRKIEQTRQEKK
ncbi:hypothetical protein [Raoultella ornithinolytica]|uniref:hypothetical protein n=1 Tax=Raoultella ornithinolytica TaxID=54291 RepID=UPI001F36A325|nr:hypothetical protein [Raoultella ornithinolytica]MCF6672333.1 hypothetical protein [Raoultella ornithinolytica]